MCAAIFPRSFRGFPRGWRCPLRGAKKSGDVPIPAIARHEAGLSHLVGRFSRIRDGGDRPVVTINLPLPASLIHRTQRVQMDRPMGDSAAFLPSNLGISAKSRRCYRLTQCSEERQKSAAQHPEWHRLFNLALGRIILGRPHSTPLIIPLGRPLIVEKLAIA